MDRVNWVVHDCFHAARQLRKASQGSSMSPASLYERTSQLVERLLADAAKAGYASEDARLMAYAVVALLDEVAMAKPGALRDHWSPRPLQLAYFKENVAGEGFFVHLDRARQDPARADVLRVFYLVLLFGFQGRYRLRGSEVALSDLLESVRSQLGRNLTVPEFLSPDAELPDASLLPGVARLPLPWIGASALVLTIVLYLGFRVALEERAEALVAWMQT